MTDDGGAVDSGSVVREFAGRRIRIDREGYLEDPDEWSDDVARTLAMESGQGELGETHWLVIRFLRDYYYENGRAPLNKQLKKGTGMSLLELENLFPDGIKRGARRLAGLPNPITCM